MWQTNPAFHSSRSARKLFVWAVFFIHRIATQKAPRGNSLHSPCLEFPNLLQVKVFIYSSQICRSLRSFQLYSKRIFVLDYNCIQGNCWFPNKQDSLIFCLKIELDFGRICLFNVSGQRIPNAPVRSQV